MLFVPVNINVGTDTGHGTLYDAGFGLTARQLRAYGAAAGNMTDPLTDVGKSLRENITGAFLMQGAWGGERKWRPLTDRYEAWKEHHVPGTPILVGIRHDPVHHRPEKPNMGPEWKQSGRMRADMLNPVFYVPSPRTMRFAPPTPYAGYHLTGTEHMVARPPVAPWPTMIRSWDRIWVRWLAGLMKRFGL